MACLARAVFPIPLQMSLAATHYGDTEDERANQDGAASQDKPFRDHGADGGLPADYCSRIEAKQLRADGLAAVSIQQGKRKRSL